MAVVNLSDYGGETRNPASGAGNGVLAECRDIVLDRLCASMCGALERIEGDLNAQFDKALSSDQAKVYSEAIRQLQLVRSEIDRKFRSAFQRSFQERTGSGKRPDDFYAGEGEWALELSLVGHEKVEEEVTVQNLASQLSAACEAELTDLKPRLAHLLGRQEVRGDRDPIGPDAICNVLKDVCWQMETPRPVKLLLLEQLARKLAAEISSLYRDINRHLIARNVLPKIRRAVRRARATGMAGSGTSVAGQVVGAREQGLPAETDLLGVLRQLLAGGADDVPLGDAPRESVGPANLEVLNILNRLQRGASGFTIGGEEIEFAPELDGGANVLHALLQTGLGRHVGSFDAALIDVVGTLFDHIFDDPRVPALIKGVIGRLQIPVLKLAFLDHSFFSNRGHPARRLINTLAQAAADWEDPFSADSSLYRKAEELVTRIQNEFVDDSDLFAACMRELDVFLAEQERDADQRTEAVARQLEQRESMEIAKAVAEETVAPHVNNGALPEAVRQFLGGPWSQVLTHAAVAGGQDGALWRCAAGTMDELVWSVLPKQGTEERRRLVQIIPSLLRALREGLEEAGIGAQAREWFFADLVKLHAAAVKAGMTVAPSRPVAATQAPLQAAPARTASAPASAPAAEQGDASAMSQLKRGCWLDVRDEFDATRRVRLAWISPSKTMYLFTNRQGERAMALTRAELSSRFAEGRAAFSDERPLMDRVVDDVLDSLQIQQ